MKHALTQYREDNDGMSLETFAALIGASKSMVWKWENHQAEPRKIFRKRIVEVTSGSVTIADLLAPEETEAAQ